MVFPEADPKKEIQSLTYLTLKKKKAKQKQKLHSTDYFDFDWN